MSDYPRWIYYPRSDPPPSWVKDVVAVFARCRSQLDTVEVHNKSDAVLAVVKPGLERVGFRVEGGEKEPVIHRPVYFGEGGIPERKYQIDSYHPSLRIGLEVEAGRSIRGNAVYRDLIQASLIVNLDYFALAIPQRYRFKANERGYEDKPYEFGLTLLDAIYGSSRLKLPLKGLLFLGF